MPVFNNALAGAAGQGGASDFLIERSLRLDEATNAHLHRTPTVSGNKQTWTVSFWFKRSTLTVSGEDKIWGSSVANNAYTQIYFDNNDKLVFNSNGGYMTTDRAFRDLAAWYHCVLAFDGTQGADADKAKMYINGQLLAYPSEFSAANLSGLGANHVSEINRTNKHTISGKQNLSNSHYYDGYVAKVEFVDGQQLSADEFGKVHDDTGEWVPLEYSGTYGTNGYQLLFQDGSDLGKDTSGQNNHWIPEALVGQVGGADQTSIANATGALPIYSTTDTYGKTIASGPTLRSDPLAQYLQWCVPFSQGSSGQLNDLSPTGRTSSTRNINGGPGSHTTAHNIFYGGSNYFSSGTSGSFSTDVWDSISASSSEFTIEFWIKLTSSTQNNGYGATILSSRSAGNNGAGWIDIGFGGMAGNKPSMRLTVSQGWSFEFNYDGTNTQTPFPVNEWTHVAVSRDSNNKVRLFGNGMLLNTQTSSVGITSNSQGLIGGFAYGSYSSYVDFYMTDVRIYTTAKYTASFVPPYPITLPRTSPELDLLLDSPTNATTDAGDVIGNFATWNAQDHRNLTSGPTYTLSNGSLRCDIVGSGSASSTARGLCVSTIQLPTSGKWFAEFDTTNLSNDDFALGVASRDVEGYYAVSPGGVPGAYMLRQNGQLYYPTGQTSSESSRKYYTGDVVGVAVNFDLDTPRIVWYRNGVIVGDNTFSTSMDMAQGPFSFAAGTDAGGNNAYQLDANFGQRPWKYPINYSRLIIGQVSTHSLYNHTKLFDGDLTTYASHSGFNTNFTWYGNLTDVTSLRIYLQTGSRAENLKIKGNLGTVTHSIPANTSSSWVTISLANTGTSVEEITFYRGAGGEYLDCSAIEVNGTVLTDDNADTGYKELCTTNLPTPSVDNPRKVFNTTLWTGTNTNGNRTISGVPFSPDMVWAKSRSHGYRHTVYDTVRGVGKNLTPDEPFAETTNDEFGYIQQFTSDGFATTPGVSDNDMFNGTNKTYAAWMWDAGDTEVTKSAGSLNNVVYDTSQVWSNMVTLTGSWHHADADQKMFDGNMNYGHASGGGTAYATFNSSFPTGKIELFIGRGGGTGATIWINGYARYPSYGWYTIDQNYLQTIEVNNPSQNIGIGMIRVNGKVLIDSNITAPNLPSVSTNYRVNEDAGFSIVEWTASGANGTFNEVAHGLNDRIDFMMTKRLDSSDHWYLAHRSIPNDYLELDDPTAKQNTGFPGQAGWGAGLDASNYTFGMRNGNFVINNDRMICYCWAAKEGVSAFGKYTAGKGTGKPFIFTGFRPALVIFKGSHSSHWVMMDSARDPYNDMQNHLHPNIVNAEAVAANRLDFYSNGFKLDANYGETNDSTNEYYYMAWAESPFVYARAR